MIKTPNAPVDPPGMDLVPELDRVLGQLTAEFHDRDPAEIERVVADSWRLFDALDDAARATVVGWHARTRLYRHAS